MITAAMARSGVTEISMYNLMIAAAMFLIVLPVTAAEPLIELQGMEPDELDPGIHCIDRTAAAVRRIAASPTGIADLSSAPASGYFEGDAEINAENTTSVGERRQREPSGLVWNLMKPMRDFQEKMRENHSREREERDHSWGASSTTRIKGHVRAGGRLSVSSPHLRGLPDCELKPPKVPKVPEVDLNKPKPRKFSGTPEGQPEVETQNQNR